MLKIKPLQWKTRTDGIVHADPKGLEWAYYIEPQDNDKFELAYIDRNGAIGDRLRYSDLKQAQEHAFSHYSKMINACLFIADRLD